MAVNKLNKTFVSQLTLTAAEMNQISGKIDELVQGVNTNESNIPDTSGLATKQDITEAVGDIETILVNIIGGGTDDYALESQMLVLPVRTTTITTSTGSTAAIATNDHIKIVDENLKHYTVKEWNDRSIANGFDNSLVAKPIGFSMEGNGVRVIFRWPFVGTTWNCLGTTSAANSMQHSMYEYEQRTTAGSGTDYHGTYDSNLGTNALGSHNAADWSITDDGDHLTLYNGNTRQSWQMPKGCGNTNFLVAFNYKDRNDAMIAQNEWMRHRFAICSGIQTSEKEGTIKEVEILNASGSQAAAGEDMYFYIDGQNTTLKAKYNLNNKYATNNAYYLTDEISEYIYSKQKENGINMNDTGVNSPAKPVLVPGAKGAEAISVNGYWYIITPYVSRPNRTQTNYDFNIIDSPAIYYANSLGENIYLCGDKELLPVWTNKNIVSGLMNYLRTYEGYTDDVPFYNTGYAWSCVRSNGYYAWFVHLGSGNCGSTNTIIRCSVWPVSAF